jgi:hypothetical protein
MSLQQVHRCLAAFYAESLEQESDVSAYGHRRHAESFRDFSGRKPLAQQLSYLPFARSEGYGSSRKYQPAFRSTANLIDQERHECPRESRLPLVRGSKGAGKSLPADSLQ